MKKTVVCSIPMRGEIDKVIYVSEDKSVPASDKEFSFPVNSFLDVTLKSGDEVSAILLVKNDAFSCGSKNAKSFVEELNSVCAKKNAKANITNIDTDFSQSKAVHEELMQAVVCALEPGSSIIADVTYGPKDVPVVVLSALYFAEKHLNCSVDNILYGQANFIDGKAVNTKLCDMIPLYCLTQITQTIKSETPDNAKEILKSLLSL